jgi:hypothetical protein
MKSNYVSRLVFGIGILFGANCVEALEASAVMGQGLYEQSGSNSCSFCHGISGTDGKVAAAAKLTTPKAWKSFKALGGDAAYSKNKVEFLKNLEDAVVDVIAKGAIAHNSSYKVAGYDLGRAGGPLNAQMLGVAGAPSSAWINKYKDRGVTKEIAARAAYLHIQSFDTQGVFK